MERKNFFLTLVLLKLGLIHGQQFDLSNAINQFTIDLLKTTAEQVPASNNLAMAPFTVWTILSALNEGAEGETSSQIETALHIKNVNKDLFHRNFQNLSKILTKGGQGVALEVTNAMYTTQEQKLRDEFAQISKKSYDIEVTPIDFTRSMEASVKINNLIAKSTGNRVQNFINAGDLSDAQIFITSILYFKGAWQTPFNRSDTRTEPFYDEARNVVANVSMMHYTGFFPYTRIESLRALAVELPYGDGERMSMICMLPFRNEKIQTVLDKMSREPFSNYLDLIDKAKIDYEGEDVVLSLPKFTIRSDLNLNRILDLMGVKDLFNSQMANLLGIFPHYLFVSRLIQSAEIEVNEEGTIATAVAGAILENKSPPPRFVANKPFLYFIINKETKTIVYAGKVSIPSSATQ